MQLRRLDPMANAGPFQRLTRNSVKSFSLSEAQYERVKDRRPGLIVSEGDAAIVGYPVRDFLEVHYAYPDIEMFVDRFPAMFEKVIGATRREESPRGLVIAFRDRPNRMTADTVFWSVALEPGDQWVEMNLVAVEEQAAPSNDLGDGFESVEVDASNEKALAEVEAAITGLPLLSPAGIASLRENSKLLRLIRSKSGAAVGVLSLRTEAGGWGAIDLALVKDEVASLRRPLLDWAVAWLRNNGGRRTRTRVGVDDSASLAVLKEAGFTPGEIGLYLTRSVDKAEVDAKLAERKSHGTLIKFGDWR